MRFILHDKRLINCFFVFLICVFFTSCGASKSGGYQKASKLYETFFVGEEGTQYFIKAMDFIADNGDVLSADITFRYKNNKEGMSSLNISIYSEVVIKKIEHIDFVSSKGQIAAQNITHMFSEREDRLIKSRFTLDLPLVELDKFFTNHPFDIHLKAGDMQQTFKANKATIKKMEALNYDLFELL